MSLLPVPAGKTMPPALPAWAVPRPRLLEQLLNAASPLVVIHTAAGFGKSTLMAQACAALERQGRAALWLTLDREDGDLSRLLRSLNQALKPVLKEPVSSLASLLDAVARASGRWVLLVDEYEHLQSEAAQAFWVQLLQRLPRGAQLCLASRRLPQLGRRDPNGMPAMTVIHEDALRFHDEDARALLLALGMPESAASHAPELLRQTEGWPLAMTLMAQKLVAGGHRSTPFTSPDRADGDIVQYLGEEVFSAQRPQLRDFLLRTCILKTLEPSLCQALCPQFDATLALADLDVNRTFLVRTEAGQVTWRYHRLFAEFLRARLRRESHDLYLSLHLLASGWFESQGRLAPAIEHALTGGDEPLAASLIERGVDDFLAQDRFRLLLRWLERLSPAAIRERPVLQVAHAWCACLIHGAARGRACLERHELEQSADPLVREYLDALLAMLLAKEDRYAEALQLGEQALSRRPGNSAFVDGVLSNLLAHVSFVLGRSEVAVRTLEVMQPAHDFGRTYRDATLGLMELRLGQLRRASARMQMALGSGRGGTDVGNPWIAVPYASALYEAGDLARADSSLAAHLLAACEASMPDHMIMAFVLRSRIAQARDDQAGAQQLLCDMEHLGLQRQLPRVAASANLERSRSLLLLGLLEAAQQALDRATKLFDWASVQDLALPAHETEDPAMGRIRLALARGDVAQARLQMESQASAAQGRCVRGMKLDVFRIIADSQEGAWDAALGRLRPLLELAVQEGYLRIVVDEGVATAPALQRLLDQLRTGSRGDRQPLLEDLIVRMLTALGVNPEALVSGLQLATPLTQKELQVLQALAEGCSNQDICERLGISDSTARTHLRSINQKLGAQSRSHAVALARRGRLLR